MKKNFEKDWVCILLALVPGKSRPVINGMFAQQQVVSSARLDARGLLRYSCRGAYLSTSAPIFRFKNVSAGKGEREAKP